MRQLQALPNLSLIHIYVEGFLRKSVVGDPLIRKNTGDNTPAIIHYDMVEGDELTLTVAPKGAGSENMSEEDADHADEGDRRGYEYLHQLRGCANEGNPLAGRCV